MKGLRRRGVQDNESRRGEREREKEKQRSVERDRKVAKKKKLEKSQGKLREIHNIEISRKKSGQQT